MHWDRFPNIHGAEGRGRYKFYGDRRVRRSLGPTQLSPSVSTSSDEAGGISGVAHSDSDDDGKDIVRDGDREREIKQQRSRRNVIILGLASALESGQDQLKRS